MSWRFRVVMMLWMAGCGSVADPDPAEPDAPAAQPASSAIGLTSAGGRMQGGGFTLDFEIGHATDQARATGGAFTLEAAARRSSSEPTKTDEDRRGNP
jgi:hypothetical protein